MAEAKIKTPSGSEITVKGTTNEVDEILKFWHRREELFKSRRSYYRNYDMGISGSHLVENSPFFSDRTIIRSPKAIVLRLIRKGFFEKYRTLSETRLKIKDEYGVHISNGSLHPTLMSLIAQDKLVREKQENDLWGYKIKG